MGNRSSKQCVRGKKSSGASSTTPQGGNERMVANVRSNRAASYRHAQFVGDAPEVDHRHCGQRLENGELNDVGCLLVSRAARETTCTMCSLDLDLMSEIYHTHRGSNPNEFERVEQHVCTRCDAIMCLECGGALNKALQGLSIESLNAVGGCTLTVRLKESLLKAKEMLGTMRRHDYCPRCHPILTKAFEEPFLNMAKRLAETVDFKFEDDVNSSFVLVDVKQVPEETRMNLLEAAAQPTPLLPLQVREQQQLVLIQKLKGWLVEGSSNPEEITTDDKLEVAGAWFTLGEGLAPIHRVEVTPQLIVGRLECYEYAVRLQPTNVMFLCAMLGNMNKMYLLTVNGESWTRLNVAERILELRPRNYIAWRNAASVSSTVSLLDFQGKKYTRHEALCRSIELAPDCKNGWYAAANLVCPPSRTLPIQGKELTRAEVFEMMLNDAKTPDEDLEDLIVRLFGPKALVFLLSEVSFACPNHPRVKKFASQFSVVHNSVIGMGAYGQVFRANRRRNGEVQAVAAKIVNSKIMNQSFQSIPELYMLMNPLFQESVAPAHFIQHDSERRRTTIFMEYAGKGSAHSYMKNEVKGRLHEGLLRAVLYQVLIALRVLHFHGVVHQDIKPPNLLVYDSMEIKLADFGVTCLTYCEVFEMEAGGTELYMPPEAYNDGTVSTAGDIWSLAATIIELASYHHPVPDPAHVREVGARHPFRPYIPDHLSTELKQMLGSMLHYDSMKRPSVERLIFDPYFAAVGLPPSAEEEFEKYPVAKNDHGIPARVRDLEELSTMGIMTRSAETMTQGTMALHTMRQRKSNLLVPESSSISLEPLPIQVERSAPPTEGASVTVVVDGHIDSDVSGIRDAIKDTTTEEIDIPSVSPLSPAEENLERGE
ncbi:protein kinase, putative [Bodo saltans]|uniref:non-specific serine/threonine protein kinase n=1 Tax=Bodo saltans TaxID=75058 RepID=A0A0S4JMY8_BODSA|nr:protein kinase, putative [Bodo saltans]|eukprot:CUG92870.1 protein kinase, putative [Bodo saltans]